MLAVLHVQVEDVADGRDGSWLTRSGSRDGARGKDSGFSSASTSTERFEPQASNGFPSYRPLSSIASKSREKPKVIYIIMLKTIFFSSSSFGGVGWGWGFSTKYL